MAQVADIIEFGLSVVRPGANPAGTAAALLVSFGGAGDASNRTGVYGDLTGSAEQIHLVAGGIDGAQVRRSGSDCLLVAQAGTRDGIALAPSGGGSSTRLATITTVSLGASRTYTLPDASMVVAGSAVAFTATHIPFGSATAGLLTGSAQMTWDDTNFIAQWKITGGTNPSHAASTALRVIRNATTTASCSLALVGGSTSTASSIYFSDDALEDAGSIRYSHSADQMSFRIQGTAYATVSATLFNHVGLVSMAAGAVGTPAVYFSTDTSTGLYRSGSNTVAIATSGVLAFSASPNSMFLSHRVGLGSGASSATFNLTTPTTGSLPTGVSQSGILNGATTSADATCTTSFYAIRISGWGTAAVAHTTASLGGLAIGSPVIGAGSTPDKIAAIAVSDPTTGATFNAAIFIGSTTLSGTGNWSLYNSATSASYAGSGAFRIGNSTAALNTDEQLTVVKMAGSGTTSVQPVLVWGSNVSGTAGAGFGVSEVVVLESSTTNNQFAYSRQILWSTATHASRAARVIESVYDAGGAREYLRADTDGSGANLAFFGAGSYGSGRGVIFITNAGVNPSTNPTGGGILYADAGAGKWRGSSGTVTTFGPAEPHCPVCGSDFGHEWHNDEYGGCLRVCMKCLASDLGNKPYIRWNEEALAA